MGDDSRCSKCGADLHCCRNCSFFDSSAEKECRQPIEARIPKKRVNNQCSFFRPVLAVDLQGAPEEQQASHTDEARKAWEALFK